MSKRTLAITSLIPGIITILPALYYGYAWLYFGKNITPDTGTKIYVSFMIGGILLFVAGMVADIKDWWK